MKYSLSEIPLVFCDEEFEIIIQPIYHEISIHIYKQSTCNNNLGRQLYIPLSWPMFDHIINLARI